MASIIKTKWLLRTTGDNPLAAFVYNVTAYLLGVKAPDLELLLGSLADTKITDPDATEATILGLMRGQLAAMLSSANPDISDRAARLLGVVTAADGGIASLGANADAAVAAGTAGSVSAKLRRLTADVDALKTLVNTGIGQWTAAGVSAANTDQTVSKAAVAGVAHYITGVDVFIRGGSPTADMVIELRDGSTVKWSGVIGAGTASGSRCTLMINSPILMSVNTAANLYVPAGGAGVISFATLIGYTR